MITNDTVDGSEIQLTSLVCRLISPSLQGFYTSHLLIARVLSSKFRRDNKWFVFLGSEAVELVAQNLPRNRSGTSLLVYLGRALYFKLEEEAEVNPPDSASSQDLLDVFCSFLDPKIQSTSHLLFFCTQKIGVDTTKTKAQKTHCFIF